MTQQKQLNCYSSVQNNLYYLLPKETED